jgi:glycosyltransferase involved in cell wall biosynthesis
MPNNEHYPRTLIVGVHFSDKSGPGTFLGRLFSSWHKDCLATISSDPEPPDWRHCQRHYRTGELKFPFRSLSHKLLSVGRFGEMFPPELYGAIVTHTSTLSKESFVRRLARSLWRKLLRITSGGEIFFHVGPSPELLAWAREFKPDVLYGHCSGLNSVLFLYRIQQELKLPLVLHIMDDMSGTKYSKGLVAKLLRPRFKAEFSELMKSADIIIAICQEMANEYENRYMRPVLSFPIPVEMDAYMGIVRTQWNAGRPFRLQFGGRVGWALRESLVDIALAVSSLRKDGIDVVFDLLTFETESVPDECRILDGVNVKAAVPSAQLPYLQVEADVLVICLDFDPESILQAKYSMPSKLAGCMASGTPILVYGPVGSPVVEYARRESWGKVVDKRDIFVLKEAIQELIDYASLREQLGRKATRLATEKHDAKIVSDEIRNILNMVCRE